MLENDINQSPDWYLLPGSVYYQNTFIPLKYTPMSVIIILLIASISVAGIFLAAFLWGVKSGQFEDDYSPASRILFDDKPSSTTKTQ